MTLENYAPAYSMYFHIPFCTHRCAYCDFNTYAGQEGLIPAYVEALCREIRLVAGTAPERLSFHTIFFGGGTPSLFTPRLLEQILDAVRLNFSLSPSSPSVISETSKSSSPFHASGLLSQAGPSVTGDTSGTSGVIGPSDTSQTSPSSPLETSLEANPGTVTLDSLIEMRKMGFNRLSLGVQSFHPDELHQLERIHDPFDVLKAVNSARRAGFENLNLDLIYGLPEQTLSRWQTSLRRAVDLNPEHLSLYALTIERGTPFGRWAAHGLLPIPDPDLAADMLEAASEYLGGQGYEQYEISNWAKPGFQCRHNLQYWRNLPYLGFGAGAHGCANGLRISNVLRIKTFIEHLSPNYPFPISSYLPFPLSPATVSRTLITPFVEMQETLMLGLRLTGAGVSPQIFRSRFGRDLKEVFGKEIDELVGLGLLEWSLASAPSSAGEGQGVRVRLTPRGRQLGNQVFMRFVG